MQTRNTASIKKELHDIKAIETCAKEFNMVGDPTRLKICYLLCRHKELSVGEVADLIDVSISAVSRTLQKLKKMGIVKNRREFRTVYYQLKPSPLVKIVRERLRI